MKPTLYWAVSPFRSGPYAFESFDEAEAWIDANSGERIDESQVDPEIVAAAHMRREREQSVT